LQSLAGGSSQYNGCTYETGFTKTADGNNHLSGFSYDASGNATADGYNSYTWDAESQLKVTAGSTYLYDGDGRRVAKANTAVPPVPYKLYWYGAGGEVLAETDAAGNTTAEYIFFAGKRVAMLPATGNPIYYVEDLLGTSRVITTNTGVVCYDADFYPFGGERAPYTNTCSQNYKFEGKERDAETGNDDFGARYYSNRFGRWLSADWSNVPVPVPYANLSNPQTLNLYAMVSDDPESFADLDGHEQIGTPITGANVTLNGVETRLNMMGQNIVYDPAEELAKYNAEQAADQAAKQAAQQQQPQSTLTVELVSGRTELSQGGTPVVENAVAFEVSVTPSSPFPSGKVELTATLHWDEAKKEATGELGLTAGNQVTADVRVGQGETSKNPSQGVYVQVRPWSVNGNFDKKNGDKGRGYIEFTATDSKGTKSSGRLKVWIENHKAVGADILKSNPFPTTYTFAAR
jgi:RHS repeat-associated protein